MKEKKKNLTFICNNGFIIFLLALLAIFFHNKRAYSAEPAKSPSEYCNQLLAGVDKKLPIDGQCFLINGDTAFMIMPEEHVTGRAIPWVWYAPTLPGLPGPEECWMFRKFLAAGIAICGIDVGESYGSPAGCTVYSAFYKEMVEKHNMSPKPCLLARSRGGLMLYNWATENPGSVACIAGIYPVCNLKSYPGLSKACQSYGLTEAELTAQLAQYNPIDRLVLLARAKVPIFHIHGDSDVVVPLKDNSGELAKRYRKMGGPIKLVVVPGQGHNMWQGYFQCQELVDFLIRYATSPVAAAEE